MMADITATATSTTAMIEDSISDNEDQHERRLAIEQPRALPFGNEETTVSPSFSKSIDRRVTCPMYVRLFCRMNGHHSPAAYTPDPPLSDEVSVYTWRDATLSELSDLIREVNAECNSKDAKFSFQLAYYDLYGDVRMKRLGVVWNSKKGKDDERTLEMLRFVQGDFIDVAIYTGNNLPPTNIARGTTTNNTTLYGGGNTKRSFENNKNYTYNNNNNNNNKNNRSSSYAPKRHRQGGRDDEQHQRRHYS